jgi:glycosyltransferase involved in cell wall biosynthesis
VILVSQMARHWAVVHAGRRDHYQVAVALHDAEALQRLLTDFYTPDLLLRWLERWRPGRAALFRARHNPSLPSRLTSSNAVQAIGPSILHRLGLQAPRTEAWFDAHLSRRAARFVRTNPKVGMVVYSYYWESLGASRADSSWGGPGVVFQVHPIAEQIRAIVTEDRARTALTYGLEREEVQLPDDIRRYRSSLPHADGLIAASSFVAQGLLDQGIPSEKIAVVPYGAQAAKQQDGQGREDPRWNGHPEPLRLLWVGQITYRKGLHHLLDAVRRLPAGSVELSLVTRSALPAELKRPLPNSVNVYSSVSDLAREAMYDTHHLFVMPSLAEGFGLVYMEALGKGLPILCTTNSGGPDIIRDEVEGFIVEPGDAEAIADRIQRCLSDETILPAMTGAARRCAEYWTWARFRGGIVGALEQFEASFDSPSR